jgi:hypothetical protein
MVAFCLTELVKDQDERLNLPNEMSFGDHDLDILEGLANRLNKEQLIEISAGEYEERQRIIEEYGIQLLDQFLEDCFEGVLSGQFWNQERKTGG